MKKKLISQLSDKWYVLFLVILLVDVFKHKIAFHGVFTGNLIEVSFLLANLKTYVRKLNVEKIKHVILIYSGVICFTLMLLFQIIAGGYISEQIIYHYLNFIIFIYFVFFTNTSLLEEIGFVIKILTIAGLCPVLLSSDTYIGEWRNDAFIDKIYLTGLVAISLCLCITDILFKKNTLMNFIFLFFIFYANMFFVQSKTAFVSLGLYLITILFLSKGRTRNYLLLGLLISIPLLYYRSDLFLSDSITNAVNIFFGSNVFNLDAKTQHMYTGTFDIRELIIYASLLTFYSSPLWGIGIGGIVEKGGFYGVMECESTYLDMLVEGGLLYFVPVFLSIIIPFITCIYNIKWKKIPSYQYYWAISILSCIIICFNWNDYLWPIFFALIGICTNLIFNRNQKIELL